MTLQPLEGFTVAVTADRRAVEQADLLERRGATVLLRPTIATEYLGNEAEVRAATAAAVDLRPDVVVLTTGIGVRAWLEAAQSWGLDAGVLDMLRQATLVARGPKAAAALRVAGLDVAHVADDETIDGVVEILGLELVEGARVVAQTPGDDDHRIPDVVAARGGTLVEVPVYRWRLPDDVQPAAALAAEIVDGKVDAVTFTSAPAVRNLLQVAEREGLGRDVLAAFNDDGVLAACVGPVCAAAAREVGIVDPAAPDVGRLGLLVRLATDELAARRTTVDIGGASLVCQGTVAAVDGRRIELTRAEARVLHALVERPGVVVPPAVLARRLGASDGAAHHVEVTVARLRRKLGTDRALVETIRRRGYRLQTGPSAVAAV